jgi:hypothetical protein
MSLLDKAKQPVVVYPEESFVDEDGNTILRPAAVGYEAMAEIQAARQSGTSARRAEQDNEGYETEETYRLRFTRQHDKTHPLLTQAAQIEWRGERWAVVGEPTLYFGSRRTQHVDYQIRRS